jgi:hypothetical protein
LLEICQRVHEAAQGSSDPLPDDEFALSVKALQTAVLCWVPSSKPYDAGVLLMVKLTLWEIDNDVLNQSFRVNVGDMVDILAPLRGYI